MASFRLPHLFKAACLAMAVMAAVAWPAQAGVLVTAPGDHQLRNNGQGNFKGILGYEFMVGSADAQVMHLGVYDAPGNAESRSEGTVGDGLEESAVVGLYRVSDEQLIAQAVIPAGDEAELVDGFRYVKIDSPVTIKAWEKYRLVMGVDRGGNAFLNYRDGGSAAPAISPDFRISPNVYHNAKQGDHASLAYPTGVRHGSPYMGPNLQYTGGGPVVSIEEPGDRLKGIDMLPGKLVFSEGFEDTQGPLPEGWTIFSQTGRDELGIEIETPGAGQTGQAMKIARNSRGYRLGKFGGLNYTLPEPADRVAVEFDVKVFAKRNFYPSLELFSIGEDDVEPSQLHMCMHLDRLQQFSGIRTNWVKVPFGLEPAPREGNASPWYRVRLVMDRHAQGIDVYLSRPDQPALSAEPVATVPAYGLNQPIKAIRFGLGAVPGFNHSWIDNIVIRTGQDIPAPGEPAAATPETPEQAYPLWTPESFPRTFGDIEYPKGLEHHIIATRGRKWNWFHGTAIEFHKGKFYASWAANAKHENAPGEVTIVSESNDGGKTWSEAKTLAPGDGKEGVEYSNSHGTLLSHNGKLWAFVQHWAGGWDNPLSTEAFILDEEKDEWESQGIVATQGWPLDRPKKMADGNWIMGVSGFKMRQPGVMVSHGDDLTKWDTIAIPTDRQQIFPETSVIVDGNNVLSITRWDGGRALVSTSTDGGRTWAQGRRSNLPMTTSKPDSGTLSTGQWYAVINIEDRDTLALAVGKPGEKGFSKLYLIRHGAPPTGEYPYKGAIPPHQYAYPYALEHDGKLYITYSVRKADCEVAIVPIASLQAE